jgi:hypothetical protein
MVFKKRLFVYRYYDKVSRLKWLGPLYMCLLNEHCAKGLPGPARQTLCILYFIPKDDYTHGNLPLLLASAQLHCLSNISHLLPPIGMYKYRTSQRL